ncbi:hypothetical protein D5S18_18705 [Nocardia panacis]|uniref:LtfC/p132/Gp6 beta-sandwich domain-containing protein n=1 Tax=Nocardia panacis TaxID=2340916 RepID=A0A3A4KIF7_9NOCA|nr:hypothetical protein [Nocardia panacis]RJO74185.1 hypothetical protein D5S18_18705 [Nocardia panacis]
MTTPLGWEPSRRPLVLSVGANFTHSIKSATSAFPAGISAWIEIRDSTSTTVLDTWNATNISTTSVDWIVAAAAAAAIPTGARYRLYVTIPTSPATTFEWFYGQVVRKQ